MKKVMSTNLVSVLNPLKDYLKEVKVATLKQIEKFAKQHNLHPLQVAYIVKAVLNKELDDEFKKKYGEWIHREDFIKQAYVKGMEVEIYDECTGEKYEGVIEDITPTAIHLRTKDNRLIEISKGCIPEWGLIYIMT